MPSENGQGAAARVRSWREDTRLCADCSQQTPAIGRKIFIIGAHIIIILSLFQTRKEHAVTTGRTETCAMLTCCVIDVKRSAADSCNHESDWQGIFDYTLMSNCR